ncbi:MAG: type II secretion system protein [Oscillospiraceae bacterium]|nr:type II secretion system protein [Oscillospiraceae bacterium]
MEENKRTKSGFTLSELLIVVAIVAILAMISIPIFTSRMEAAKENTCTYNRKTLQRVLMTEQMTGNTIDMKQIVASLGIDGAEYKGVGKITGMCPEGDCTVIQKDGVYRVVCSKHSEGEYRFISDPTKMNVLVSDDKKDLFERFHKFFDKKDNVALDSTGRNYGQQTKERLAEELGIKGDFYFRIFKSGNEYRIYISEPITNEDIDKQIKYIQYTMDDKGNVADDVKEGEAKVGINTWDGTNNAFLMVDFYPKEK